MATTRAIVSDNPGLISSHATADLNEFREAILRLRRERERLIFERDAAEIGCRQQLMELCRAAAQHRGEQGDLSDAIKWLEKLVAIARKAEQEPRLAVTELDPSADQRRLTLLRFIERACGTELPFPAGRRDRRIVLTTVVCNREEAELVDRVLWPCLLSDGNVPALTRRGEVIHQVFTTAFAKPFLSRSLSLEQLAKTCKVEFVIFPSTIVPERAPRWQLGREIAAIGMRQARSAQADLIVLRPDMILSNHALETVLERSDTGTEAVFTTLVGLDEQKIMPTLLEQQTKKKELSLDAGQLADLALRTLSQGTLAHVVAPDNDRYFPDSAQLIWPREDGLITRSAKQHPLFLSYSLLSRNEVLPWIGFGTKLVEPLLGCLFATVHVNQNLRNCGIYLLAETTHTPAAPSFFNADTFAERVWRRSARLERWLFDHRVHLPGACDIPYRTVSDTEIAEREVLVDQALLAYQPELPVLDEPLTEVYPGRALLPKAVTAGAPVRSVGLAELNKTQLIPSTEAAVINLEAGIYALSIGEVATAAGDLQGIGIPAIQICPIENGRNDPVQIDSAASGSCVWISARGGGVIIKAPENGGLVLITVYGQYGAPPAIDIRRIEPAADLINHAPTQPVRKVRGKPRIGADKSAVSVAASVSPRSSGGTAGADIPVAEQKPNKNAPAGDDVSGAPQSRNIPRRGASAERVPPNDFLLPPNGQVLLRTLLVNPVILDSTGHLSVPVVGFCALLSVLATRFLFDEKFYMTNYPDIAEAKESGFLGDLQMHFLVHGYIEGRLFSYPEVDELFYLDLYQDVTAGIANGDIIGAVEHYLHGGAAGGRFATAAEMETFKRWRQLQSVDTSLKTSTDITLPSNGRVLLDALMITVDMVRSLPKVPLSAPALRTLLDLFVSTLAFDEDFYMTRYPDVAEEMAAGLIASPHMHFRRSGYFEGRIGAPPEVDELFYKETYPDVAVALANGQIKSGFDHYLEVGATEGRLASAHQMEALSRWEGILHD